MSDRKSTVVFIGLGMMGAPMAGNVVKHYPTVVFDIDPAKNQLLVDMGVQVATGAADMAQRASTLISMVDTTTQAEDVIRKASGNSAAFQHAAPRAIKRDFKGIRMDITFKDLELETQLAKALQVRCFMANVAQQVYQMGRASGFGSEDTSAIVKVYEQFAGVSL